MRPFGKKRGLTVLGIVTLCCFAVVACTTSTLSENTETGHEGQDFLSDPEALSPVDLVEGEILKVVATTNIVGDIVSNVGGSSIELTTLLPVNADPHAYEPAPGDLQAVSNAHVIFVNGLGLEVFLEGMLENAGVGVPVVSLSEGIEALTFGKEVQNVEGSSEDLNQGHDQGSFDPHVWFDPTNVMVWTERVAETLSILDPANGALYVGNAAKYKEALVDLDNWIMEQVSVVPEADRKFVTDHRDFDYFAVRYGFDVIGAVIPVYSSAAEPSAQEIAELQLKVQEFGVKTLFVGMTVNPNIVRALVEDTGIDVIRLYTGSLSDPLGPAGSYIDLMKFDVESIVNGLLE
jgi:ABC-type Zn uptake system ZnuABC Zn-binding protein ZnuA